MPPREERKLPRRRVGTIFLRVPSQEWPRVSTGRVNEFRASLGNVPQLWNVPLPMLAVAYRKRRAPGDYDHKPMVLEAVRLEALGAITDDGLKAAGYTGPRQRAYAEFRRHWMIREKRRFEPLRKVMVFRVRPVQWEQDIERVGLCLVKHLYGDFIPEGTTAAAAMARFG